MIENDLRLGDVDLKAKLPGRGACHLTLRGARVCFGDPPQRGLVQMVHNREVTLPAFVAETPTDTTAAKPATAPASTAPHSRRSRLRSP